MDASEGPSRISGRAHDVANDILRQHGMTVESLPLLTDNDGWKMLKDDLQLTTGQIMALRKLVSTAVVTLTRDVVNEEFSMGPVGELQNCLDYAADVTVMQAILGPGRCVFDLFPDVEPSSGYSVTREAVKAMILTHQDWLLENSPIPFGIVSLELQLILRIYTAKFPFPLFQYVNRCLNCTDRNVRLAEIAPFTKLAVFALRAMETAGYVKTVPGYRGMIVEGNRGLQTNYDNYASAYNIGKLITFSAFTSVSLEDTVADAFGDKIFFHFIAVRGIDVSGLSAFPEERELIMIPPVVFRVIGTFKLKGQLIINAELVNQPGATYLSSAALQTVMGLHKSLKVAPLPSAQLLATTALTESSTKNKETPGKKSLAAAASAAPLAFSYCVEAVVVGSSGRLADIDISTGLFKPANVSSNTAVPEFKLSVDVKEAINGASVCGNKSITSSETCGADACLEENWLITVDQRSLVGIGLTMLWNRRDMMPTPLDIVVAEKAVFDDYRVVSLRTIFKVDPRPLIITKLMKLFTRELQIPNVAVTVGADRGVKILCEHDYDSCDPVRIRSAIVLLVKSEASTFKTEWELQRQLWEDNLSSQWMSEMSSAPTNVDSAFTERVCGFLGLEVTDMAEIMPLMVNDVNKFLESTADFILDGEVIDVRRGSIIVEFQLSVGLLFLLAGSGYTYHMNGRFHVPPDNGQFLAIRCTNNSKRSKYLGRIVMILGLLMFVAALMGHNMVPILVGATISSVLLITHGFKGPFQRAVVEYLIVIVHVFITTPALLALSGLFGSILFAVRSVGSA
jgi:hypothetical protein